MQIIKFLIVTLILTARIYQAEIVISTSSPDKSTSDLVEGLIKIVTSCYGDHIKAVGLAGNLPETLSRTLSVQHLIPTTLMADTSHRIDATTVDVVPDKFRYKLHVFTVGASSYTQLKNIIELLIKTSIWWNPMASFFILDQSHGCVNISYFIFIAWQMDLLNAKVMCYHHKYGGYIFNYNPFTSQAPFPWTKANVIEGINKHPFTLFRQQYQGNEAICVDLDFEKTRDLGGYEVHIQGSAESLKFRHQNWPGLSRIAAERERILHIIYRTLNATLKFTGLKANELSDNSEIHIRYSVAYDPHISTTYPYQQKGLVLITKFRGHKSQLEKILYVVDRNSRIGMGIVYLVTLIFFKFFVHQFIGPAILNLVRITCNTAFSNLPDNTASRMYLTGLLFFVVTMQGIYQGNLASLLTNKIPVKNVDSLTDLVNFGYKLYGLPGVDMFLERADVKERFIVTVDADQCITYMMNDPLAACITFAQGDIFDDARHNDLHLSQEFITQLPIGFVIRRSWYLEQQVNKILGIIMEDDIFETWESKCNPTKLDDFKFDKEVRKNTDFKIIEFSELHFAFVILGIGLLCASVTFIVEVAIYQYQQNNNNTVIVL